MCSSHIIWSYHTKVILSANLIGNIRCPKILRFQWFSICQKNLLSSAINPKESNCSDVRSSWFARRYKFWCRLHSWCLPLSENFDGWSLLGAELFAFEICLENCTNFEDKNLVFTRFIYLMILISARSWALCAWIRGDLFEGSFWRFIIWVIFWVIFGGHFWGHFGGSGVGLPRFCLEI